MWPLLYCLCFFRDELHKEEKERNTFTVVGGKDKFDLNIIPPEGFTGLDKVLLFLDIYTQIYTATQWKSSSHLLSAQCILQLSCCLQLWQWNWYFCSTGVTLLCVSWYFCIPVTISISFFFFMTRCLWRCRDFGVPWQMCLCSSSLRLKRMHHLTSYGPRINSAQ